MIYFDESRFDTNCLQRRSWAAPYRNNYAIKNSVQRSLNVYAAVGQLANGYFIEYYQGCNSANFADFIPKLIKACRDSRRKPMLVLDRHTSHTAIYLQEILKSHFKIMLQPTQACEFNIVETHWSLAKRHFRKKLAERPLQ